jgi:uncharacterized protein with HEPN domain
VKDDRVYLGHIREAIHDIEEYTAGGRDAFMSDRMRQDAVIRKLEIVGEAVKHLSEETTERRPDIPWKRIAGMRDRLTHDYFGVDLALVWTAVERDVPPLRSGRWAVDLNRDFAPYSQFRFEWRPKSFPVGTRSVHFWPRCARCGILGRGGVASATLTGSPEEITPRCDGELRAAFGHTHRMLAPSRPTARASGQRRCSPSSAS